MIMPAVTRRRMAMNESICTTCCYRVVASPTNYYWEVQNGGLIQETIGTELIWKENIPKAWAELSYDVDYSAWEGLHAKPSYSFEDDTWWVLYYTKDSALCKVLLRDFISGPDAMASVTNEGCRHIDHNCLYIDAVPAFLYEHVDATEPHKTAGVNFSANHAAMQFNS